MPSFSRFTRRRSSRFVLFGVALLIATASTQAQTPTFDVAEYAERNQTDAAAASFADRVARRSAAARVSNVQRSTPTSQNVRRSTATRPASNAPVATSSNLRPTDAPKSQAAQTLEAFLFGSPKRPLSTPKFAFAQRDDASPVRVSRSAQSVQPLQIAPTDAPTTDAEIAAARRRRLQELNALLATRRPEEFSRRLALKNAAPVDAPQDLNASAFEAAPALPFLVAESSAEGQNAVFQDRAELASDAAPFNSARANRSKIRQASNLEPARPLELADDGLATFLLPTRPNALRLSPNVFLSTDLVRLPNAAPLREASQTAPTARPLQEAQTPATVATPLPAETSADVPTLRPTAQFVEPRSLPTRR